MNESNTLPPQNMITRRQLLERLPAPALATVLAMEIYSEPTQAQTTKQDINAGTKIYNLRSYGAKGDGVALDTASLQAAVDACHEDGGGVVLVPSGVFQIGTVELKSNVTLRISAGGKLLGSGDGKQYHAIEAIPLSGDSTMIDGNWALLFAVEATNVTIEGEGTIDGQGAKFHSPVRGALAPSGLSSHKRPYHLLCYRCERLTVRGIELVDGAYHSVRVIQSSHVRMEDLMIHNRVNGNNDGFHFISARFVYISNCTVLSQDDACAMFGSCQFFTITNCVFSTRWSVFRFGGGVAENITISNCVLYDVFGCPIKFEGHAGSRFEHISFSNLVLNEVTGPICISIGPETLANAHTDTGLQPITKNQSNEPAMARDISFSNIHGTVTTNPPQLPESNITAKARPGERASCITLNCVGNAIMEKISFDNVHLTFGGGGSAEDASRRDLPQIAGEYFALGPMPAYGFYARNSRAITMTNIRFEVSAPDMRPALILDHVDDFIANGISIQANAHTESALRFIDVHHILICAARLLSTTPAFLQLEGSSNKSIRIDGGDLTDAAEVLVTKSGALDSSVVIRP